MTKFSSRVRASTDGARIARIMLNAWELHQRALDEDTLPYLDRLMDEITVPKPLTPDMLVTKLRMVVPGLQLGTARRLIDLKYGYPGDTELLGAALN